MREALKDVPEYRFPPPQGGRTKRTKSGKGSLDFEYYPDRKSRYFMDSEQGLRSRVTKRNKTGSSGPRKPSGAGPSKSGSGKSIESLF
jgi:membrane carboxypeptidase/penicillin-binding protein